MKTRRIAQPEHPLASENYRWYYALVDFYNVFRHLYFPFIMLIISVAAFCLIAPGRDMMRVLGDCNSPGFHFYMSLFLSWWSAVIWYGSRVVLHYSRIEFISKKISVRIQVWLPRAFGDAAFFIFMVALVIAGGKYAWKYVFLYLAVNILVVSFYVFRRKIVPRKFEMILPGALPFAFKDYFLKWQFIAFSFFLWLILFLCILFSPIAFPRWLTPIGVIITAFAGWSAVGLVMKVIDKIKYFPVLATTFLCALLFTRLNYNHIIDSEETPASPGITAYFDSWMEERTIENDSIGRYPVFIVSAEGGASRSAYWTGMVLAHLQYNEPLFYDHVFAMTSVSGGSLGTGTFFLMQQNMKAGKITFDTDRIVSVFDTLLSEDYLSPISAGLLYPDMLQNFLPFRVSYFSRAKYLQESWEKAWGEYITGNPKKKYTSYWENGSRLSPPLLALNTTHVESGERAVINYASFNPALCDLNDVMHINQLSPAFTLAEAVSTSAAFTYLSPGARLRKTDNKFWGSLVDGGYFENSGVFTAMDIYNHVKIARNFDRAEVYFIVIRDFADAGTPPPDLWFNEELDPPRTILNTRGARTPQSFKMLENLVNPDQIYKIQLDNSSSEVPVSWYLSGRAIDTLKSALSRQQPVFDMIDALIPGN